MSGKPILLMGDDPSATSGLARILRDLATLLSSMPEFRVATLGHSGTGSSRLPWTQYHMQPQEMGELSLPQVWEEHSKGDVGVIFPVWDATRLLWLARPEFCEVDATRQWLERRRKDGMIHLWAYMPFDACGPGGKFTTIVKETLLGIDRVLVPSPVALKWVVDTIGAEEAERRGADWLPHGLSLKTFSSCPIYSDAGDASDVKRVGVVATNQVRKDWGLVATTCAILAERLKGEVKFWWHADIRERHWNLNALIADFALGEYVELSGPPSDDRWLAEQYRKCDATFLPSSGEGFGYSLFESLACGTPVVHGDYAGGASVMRTCGLDGLLVEPRAWRIEGVHDCVRPVYTAEDFADRIQFALGIGSKANVDYASKVEHLSWMKLGHAWKRWFKEGL